MKYLLMTKTRIHVPGDQRSIDAPGHGYPAHTDTYDCVEVFEDEVKLKDKIKKLTDRKEKFTLYRGEEVNVTADRVVKLGD